MDQRLKLHHAQRDRYFSRLFWGFGYWSLASTLIFVMVAALASNFLSEPLETNVPAHYLWQVCTSSQSKGGGRMKQD